MTRPDQTRPDQTRPDQTRPCFCSCIYDYLVDWLRSEEVFIFWMTASSFVFCGINFRNFGKGLLFALRDTLTFGRNIAIVFYAVILSDVILYVFLRKFKLLHRIAKFILLAVNVCMFVVNIFTIYKFGILFNSKMLRVATSTNFRETREFIAAYLLDIDLWLFFAAIFLALCAARYVFSVLRRYKTLMLIIVTIGTITGAASVIREQTIPFNKLLARCTNSIGLYRLRNMLKASYGADIGYNKILEKIPENIHLTKNESTIPFVVFIFGESTNRNHMQIYGYKFDNTQELLKLKDEGRLYVFDDVISPHGLTQASLQKVFTFLNYEASGKWYEHITLFSILSKAGYYTVWLSHQDSTIETRLYSGQCSYYDSTVAVTYDESILPLLDKALTQEHEKNFYLLHIEGTHMMYYNRYPSKYNIYSPEQETGSSYKVKFRRATYDNAVYYNDFVVREIIRRFEDKNAIVIYISDHGEEVHDTINFMGHNDGMSSSHIIEIPMLIWLSQKFSESYPELEQRIAASIHRPYMTDDMIHTVLDIMSIETDEYDPSRSIINPLFNSSRPRIYSGQVYNKETGLHALP